MLGVLHLFMGLDGVAVLVDQVEEEEDPTAGSVRAGSAARGGG